jgi:hypothetical protein
MTPTVTENLADMNAYGIDLLASSYDPVLAFTIFKETLEELKKLVASDAAR